MRINKYIAATSELSRRRADEAIKWGRVTINGRTADVGDSVTNDDTVKLDGKLLQNTEAAIVLLLHKPTGYVCSRDGQGSKTVYDLIPEKYQHLQIAGRLDKNSSGLLVLSNSGSVIQDLTHPSRGKEKLYEITLYKPLEKADLAAVTQEGVDIGDDRPSQFKLTPATNDTTGKQWLARLQEGRNRQIRRTFEAIGYTVKSLHRISLGPYKLGHLSSGNYTVVNNSDL